jgi:serpin B
MTRRLLPLAALAALALVSIGPLAGCSDDPSSPDPPTPVGWTLQESDLPREVAPQVPASDAAAVAAGNHAFALDLYHRLAASDNLLVCPVSIRTALAMTWAGARDATSAEMAAALSLGLPQDRLHRAFNARDQFLAGRRHPGDDDAPPLVLDLTSAIWGRLGYPFVPAYLDLLAVQYGTGVYTADFRAEPDRCRREINAWVAGRTADHIVELLPERSITSDTAVVLINTLLLQACWRHPFDPDATHAAQFTRLDGSTVTVAMMAQAASVRYAEAAGCQVLELPLASPGDPLAVVLILPPEGDFASFAGNLDAATLGLLLGTLDDRHVGVQLPRFAFSSTSELREPLRAMGMVRAFDPSRADFGGMTENDVLWIDQVYHQAFLGVDEDGVEAAAATAVVMADGAYPTLEFRADRPFLVLIRDTPTDTILFLGQVTSP